MAAYLFNDMSQLVAAVPAAGDTATLLGYHAKGDGGGGEFRWDAASSATAIQGMVVAAGGGGAGRWRRIHDGTITDRMCGARVDGTHDDAALQAMASYVTAHADCRTLAFAPGMRRVVPGGGAPLPFRLSGIDGVVLVFPGCEFRVAVDQTTTASNTAVFDFQGCKRVKFVGMPRFTADQGFDTAYLEQHGIIAGKGTVPVQLTGDCSHSEVEVEAEGVLMGVNFARNPRLTVHPRRAARVAAGGTGYTAGDVLTLSSIGAAATTAATFTVAGVDGAGAVTAVATTTRGVFPGAQGTNGLNSGVAGFAVTGGTGSGALLLPYLADYDVEQGSGHARFCRAVVVARTCYYGLHAQYNLSDSVFRVDADFVFRACVHYGGQENNVGTIRQRNIRNDSLSSGSSQGLGTDLTVHLTQLPTTSSTFGSANSPIRIAFGDGLPAEVRMRVTFDVEVDAAPSLGNHFGTLFEVDKRALNNSDITYARGHIGHFSIGGRILGSGRLDSGLGPNVLLGTNVSVPSASWAGERLHWRLEDGFHHEGRGNIIINARSLARLEIGKISSDGAITTEDLLTPSNASRFIPGGPVVVDPGAVFRNRHVASVFDTCLGDILVNASFPVSPNLSGTRYHMGDGTGTTIVASLPPATVGLEYTFQNGIVTAGTELHLAPSGVQVIQDGASVGGAGKKWRLTGLGATVTLRCFRTGRWSIVDSYGAQSIEP